MTTGVKLEQILATEKYSGFSSSARNHLNNFVLLKDSFKLNADVPENF